MRWVYLFLCSFSWPDGALVRCLGRDKLRNCQLALGAHHAGSGHVLWRLCAQELTQGSARCLASFLLTPDTLSMDRA